MDNLIYLHTHICSSLHHCHFGK